MILMLFGRIHSSEERGELMMSLSVYFRQELLNVKVLRLCCMHIARHLQPIWYFIRNAWVILQCIDIMFLRRLILKQKYEIEAFREATAAVCRLIDVLNKEPLMATIHFLTRQLCSHLCSNMIFLDEHMS